MTTPPSGPPDQPPARPGAWVMVLLAARFVLEIALLVALAVGAVSVLDGPGGWLLALALVVLAAVVWGVLLSPRRRVGLPLPARLVVELALFGGAGLLLAAGGHAATAAVLVVAEVVVLAALGGPDRHAGAFG